MNPGGIATIHVTRWYWWGSRVSAAVDKGSTMAMEEEGEDLLETANRHVPYEDGVLMASGDVDSDVDRVGFAAANIEVAVSYDTEYAVKLHEHPEFHFQGSGEGKWLEHALQKKDITFIAAIASALMKVFRLP